MRKSDWRILLTVTALSTLMASVPGCLVSAGSNTTHTGTSVAPSTFEQIKVNSTTIGWVHATLGEPSNKTNDGGDEVWKYTYCDLMPVCFDDQDHSKERKLVVVLRCRA